MSTMHRSTILVLWLSVLRVAVTAAPQQQRSGPTLNFFNYSGMQATISCEDHAAKYLDAGATFSIPLSRSDQACVVTLEDGEHAAATIDKLLPQSSSGGSAGHSVSVDINDTFLFFALDETPHHQYLQFHQQHALPERSSDLLLWSMENASDE